MPLELRSPWLNRTRNSLSYRVEANVLLYHHPSREEKDWDLTDNPRAITRDKPRSNTDDGGTQIFPVKK